MSKAIEDVIAERQRQQIIEGWTPEHDDTHTDNALADAAACYVVHYAAREWVFAGDNGPAIYSTDPPHAPPPWGLGSVHWPKHWDLAWWKPKDPRRDLVRAAALIVAEIERLDRLATAK
jgi:hypothetical protein